MDLNPVATGVAYIGVGGMLVLLFRLVMRTLSVKDVEMVRLVGRLAQERDRAVEWQQYERQRADHWYARALGDPNPPPLPSTPTSQPVESPPPFTPPPE